jgi:hypothetical protein
VREILASRCLRELSCITRPTYTNSRLLALHLQGSMTEWGQLPPVCFDSDSIQIGVNNHVSRCMVNDPHLLENAYLTSNIGQGDGISNGLDIQGEGTLKFSIEDDKGKVYTIRIPNSLYLPDLRRCLLSPQHWAQEAGDGQTWMGNYERNCVLNWKGGRKMIPFNATTNTPIFYTASSLRAYCTFTTTFEVLEAPFFRWEKLLQFPGCGHTIDKPDLVPEEFVAEENVNYQKDVSAIEGANADDRTVKTTNLPSPPQEEELSRVIWQGPLTFDPSPLTKEAKDVQLAAANDQAKLIQWHYRLSHLSFLKLKQLALNGKIPKKLAKVLPPKCAGCLFGAMTKHPW